MQCSASPDSTLCRGSGDASNQGDMLAGRRLLIAYSNSSTFTTTTREYLESFARHLRGDVHYLHVTHRAEPHLDINSYDAVLLSYCARLCFPGYVSEHFLSMMDGFQGVRAIAIQDEYDFVENERAGLDRLRPDIVFTCIPADQREKVYPSARYPKSEFVQVLTGYVATVESGSHARVPVAQRPIAIGYRGRALGHRYGLLAHMKQSIGEVFKAEAQRRGVAADIAVDEQSRIYGDAWYEWLGKCRCVLATESGSNVFDWDGSIAKACADSAAAGTAPPAEVLREIEARDREFSMGQISARIFEAASVGTPLALYRGRYSDAIEPGTHYIPIEPDHSNLDEVFRRIGDTDALQEMADRAYVDLIASGRFDYSAFVGVVADKVGRRLAGRPAPSGALACADLDGGTIAKPQVERPTLRPRSLEVFQVRMNEMLAQSRLGRVRIAVRRARKHRLVEPALTWCGRQWPIRVAGLWVRNQVIRRIYRGIVRRTG